MLLDPHIKEQCFLMKSAEEMAEILCTMFCCLSFLSSIQTEKSHNALEKSSCLYEFIFVGHPRGPMTLDREVSSLMMGEKI